MMPIRNSRASLMSLAVVATLAITGCSRSNNSGSAASGGEGSQGASGGDQAYAAARSHGGGSAYGGGGGYGERVDHGPVPMFHGEPEWSENRSHSAQENAEYHFQRAGADLGSKTLDDFLTKVHHFGDHPPAGTLKLTRANGDRLLYDPKANLFAVFNKEGAPRTVFKPSGGMDYWNEQKAREQADAGGGGYRHRSYGGGGYSHSEEGGSGSGSGDQGD